MTDTPTALKHQGHKEPQRSHKACKVEPGSHCKGTRAPNPTLLGWVNKMSFVASSWIFVLFVFRKSTVAVLRIGGRNGCDRLLYPEYH